MENNIPAEIGHYVFVEYLNFRKWYKIIGFSVRGDDYIFDSEGNFQLNFAKISVSRTCKKIFDNKHHLENTLLRIEDKTTFIENISNKRVKCFGFNHMDISEFEKKVEIAKFEKTKIIKRKFFPAMIE